MRSLAAAALIALAAAAAQASAPVPGGITVVNVNGMVCDFCARSIEAMLTDRAEVEAVKVDLDARTVTVDFRDGQTIADADISKLIVDSGYAVGSIDHKAP